VPISRQTEVNVERVGQTIPAQHRLPSLRHRVRSPVPDPLPGRDWDAKCSLCGSKRELGWRESDNVCFCGECIDVGRHTDISIEEVLRGSVEVLEELDGI